MRVKMTGPASGAFDPRRSAAFGALPDDPPATLVWDQDLSALTSRREQPKRLRHQSETRRSYLVRCYAR